AGPADREPCARGLRGPCMALVPSVGARLRGAHAAGQVRRRLRRVLRGRPPLVAAMAGLESALAVSPPPLVFGGIVALTLLLPAGIMPVLARAGGWTILA